MSSHLFYIWAAYGVSALLLLVEVGLLWRRGRALARRRPPAQDGEDRP